MLIKQYTWVILLLVKMAFNITDDVALQWKVVKSLILQAV